jgi:hypothetical protein
MRDDQKHTVGIVWQAIQDYDPPAHYVMFQERIGQEWSPAYEFRGSSWDIGFYRPAITALSSGVRVWTWDDGSSVYKAVRSQDWWWDLTEVYASSMHANLTNSGTSGPLDNTRLVSMSTTGPPYRLQLSEPTSSPMVKRSLPGQLYSRRAEAVELPKTENDTTAYLSVELSRIMLKMNDGSIVPVEFVGINDTLPGTNENTLWTQLSTVGVRVTSSIDSVFVEGTVSARALPRIRANGADGHRLLFDLVDARTGEVIGRVGGERLFTADGRYTLRERARVLNLTGREVLIRPSLRGMVKARPDMAYTIVHVHTLTADSSVEALNLAAKSQAGTKTELSSEFALHQNYPNPFNPSTQINFDLPEPGNVSLVVYDVLGREVGELASGYHDVGYHTAIWDGKSMSGASVASGIYFIRLTVSNNAGEARFVRSMKLVVMK